LLFEFVPNPVVELLPRLVVWRDDEGPLAAGRVVASDRAEPLLSVGDLVHASLLTKLRDGFTYPTLRQVLNDVLEICIALPDDFVQLRRLHAGVLELLERLASIHCLVLARVSDQERAIVRTHSLEELSGLFRTDEAGFINDVEVSPSTASRRLSQVGLKRRRFDASFLQLRRRPRRRCEAVDFVALTLRRVPYLAQGCGLPGAGNTLKAEHAVAVRQDFVDGPPLAGAQVAATNCLFADSIVGQRPAPIPALLHEFDVSTFGRDHRRRCVLSDGERLASRSTRTRSPRRLARRTRPSLARTMHVRTRV
jgi:hypothetical protein